MIGNNSVNNSIRSYSIFVALLIINLIGILLRYLGLDTYVILFGFRFQLSLVLPLLFFLKVIPKDFIKDVFKNPKYGKGLFFISLLIIPLLILFAILFITRKIEFSDPEYFYEFGLSSIVDFPIYLVWNSIQLILFFLFLLFISSFSKLKFTNVFLILIFLFDYEFIPLRGESIDYFQFISLILSASAIGILLKYFHNIYWLIIFSFSILWLHILLFGSKSELLINLILASRYNSWEGFFSIQKELKTFLLPANLLLTNIFLLFSLLKREEN